MKHQALFSSKDKSKKLKCRLLQFLFVALRVKSQTKLQQMTLLCYRIYPKYLDTVNVRTRYFFLKRHLFYVPYISRHVHNRVFLLPVNFGQKKTCPLFFIKLTFSTT